MKTRVDVKEGKKIFLVTVFQLKVTPQPVQGFYLKHVSSVFPQQHITCGGKSQAASIVRRQQNRFLSQNQLSIT
jgi:hypothetical protein